MQQGSDDRARVDHSEPVLGATLARQGPGGTLGDGLGAHVGGQAVRVRVGPVLLRQRSLFGALREPDRGDGGGDDHPLHVVVECLAEHTQCALAGRDDQLVRVLRLVRREGGGHVQDVVAALDDVVPVLVAHQVGLMNGQVVGGIDLRRNRLVHLPLAGGIPDGGPDAIAAANQLDDAPAAEIAGPAGDQNRLAVALCHRPYSITPVARAGATDPSERSGLAKSTWTSRSRRSRKPASLIASQSVQRRRNGSS